jgi:hypothetical protein
MLIPAVNRRRIQNTTDRPRGSRHFQLLVHAPAWLAPLAPPWSTVQEPGEIVLEIKMPGDHLDMMAIDRAVLRRNARQVQRREEMRDKLVGEGRMEEARSSLRHVLALRVLALSAEDAVRLSAGFRTIVRDPAKSWTRDRVIVRS